MKFLILINVIVFLPFWSFDQEADIVQYSLLFTDCCSKKIETRGTIFTDWYVRDSNGVILTPNNNIVYLDKNKKYYLYNEGFGILNELIRLTEAINIDTITNSCLNAIYPNFFTLNPIYLDCKDTVNGIYIEYYPNGRIRKKANFKNGRISDSLNSYYSNGGLKSSISFNPKDTIYKTLYPNGQVSYFYNSSKRNTFSYFKDGSVESKRSNSKKNEFNKYTKEQLWYKKKKTKQTSYYRNGNINQKLRRKPLFFMDRFKSEDKKRAFEYNLTVYDTTGNKAKEVIFYSKNALQLYSTDLYIALEKFSRVSYFENGEITVLFYPEYYREENISFPVKYSMWVYENGEFKYSKDLLPPAYLKIIKEYEIKFNQLTTPSRH